MAKINDITIDVKANLNVSHRTAETYLKLVEIFCNDKGINVIAHHDEDGYISFEFENKNKPKISPETLEALNALGRDVHNKDE